MEGVTQGASSDRRLVFLLSRARNTVIRKLDERMAALEGATFTQAAALIIIASKPGIELSALGALMSVRKSGMTSLVERLVREKYVRVEPSEADGRAKTLQVTETGQSQARRALLIVREVQSALLEGFDETEQAAIFRFLSKASNIEL